MNSLIFSLEASLLAPLLEFALSPSGHVEPRRGLALGWVGSVVAGLAVVFGTADRAQAGPCTAWQSTGSPCTVDCTPPIVGEWFERDCYEGGQWVQQRKCWC